MSLLFIIFSLSLLPRPDAGDYPGASAIYLLDSMDVTIGEDFSQETNHHILMRIFNKRGRDRHSNFMQRYDKDSEELEILLDKTHTIKENGDIVRISEEEGISDLTTVGAAIAPAYSNARIKVCAFGGVEVGDILEYTSKKVTVETEDTSKAIFGSVSFASDEPILRKKFVLEVPPDLETIHKTTGDISVYSMMREGRLVYIFSSDSIPRVGYEEWMLPLEVTGRRVIYTTFTSWDEVGEWLRDNFEESLEYTGELVGDAKELGNLDRICQAVAVGWRDVPVGFEDVGFTPTNTEKIYRNRYASPLDKVALLISMLRVIGENAYPAYVAPYGVDEEIPAPLYFDDIIVAVESNGDYIFLDPVFPSGQLYRAGISGILVGDENTYPLPYNRGYGTCFIVEGDSSFFYQMDNRPSKSEVEAELELSDDGSLKGRIRGVLRGVDAAIARKNLRGKLPKELKQEFEGFAGSIKPGSMSVSWGIYNLDSILSPVIIELEFDSPEYLTKFPKEYRLNLTPNIFRFFPLPSYFGCESRESPFTVLSPHITEFSVTTVLPIGFKPKYIPEPLFIDNDLLISSYDFYYEDGRLKYKSVWGFKKGIYTPEDYKRIEGAYTEYVSPTRSFFLLEDSK